MRHRGPHQPTEPHSPTPASSPSRRRPATAGRCPDPARPSTTPAKGGQQTTGPRGPQPGRDTSRRPPHHDPFRGAAHARPRTSSCQRRIEPHRSAEYRPRPRRSSTSLAVSDCSSCWPGPPTPDLSTAHHAPANTTGHPIPPLGPTTDERTDPVTTRRPRRPHAPITTERSPRYMTSKPHSALLPPAVSQPGWQRSSPPSSSSTRPPTMSTPTPPSPTACSPTSSGPSPD